MATTPADAAGISSAAPRRQAYVRAVGPRLRKLLYAIFALVALLGANSIYLAAMTFLEWVVNLRSAVAVSYQGQFYQYNLLVHLVLGLALIVPFVVFGVVHMLTSRNRRNRRAVRIGYALFAVSLLLLITGVLLMRFEGVFDIRHPLGRSVVYWLHVAAPLFAGWLYWLHRLAGPRIKWRIGGVYAGVVGAMVLGMAVLHFQDPREWNATAPQAGDRYFEPSLARTATGKFIPAEALMMNEYCLKCHQDTYNDWFHSAHHFSSFNNPAYLASVRETREHGLKVQGSVQSSRWCAGCHDPAPFFSGAFDDPKFDDVNHATAQAGITCITCHAITSIGGHGPAVGNGDYVIELTEHYPFTFSENSFLQLVNQQLIKAKPAFHKQSMLKPFHKTAEFCATCHKVHLPKALNDYREFLRGQNHYDPYLVSGVSGHGARSFYYPEVAKENCAACHMPAKASTDFAARPIDGSGELQNHSHFFPAANTAIGHFHEDPAGIAAHREFLKGVLRVDIFGLKEGGTIDGELHAPLRPNLPELQPGGRYLLETVVRTLKMGHAFTQGTVDSNEVWMDVTVTSGGRTIGRSGGRDERSEVDRWSHFVNVFMLDREGNRINRRNPQDIFVPLYNHQIPPGAAAVVHYDLQLPDDLDAAVTIEVKLQYRKFDQEYMDFVTRTAKPGDRPIRGHAPGEPYVNDLPIATLAVDRVTLPVAGAPAPAENAQVEIPEWQRWNDYGIGLLLEGEGGARGELRQAAAAFGEVEKLKQYHGPLNLARVHLAEGLLDEATAAIARAAEYTDPPAPPWTMSWLSGLINRQQGHLEAAEENFRGVLEMRTQAMIDRKFDFSLDYEVINELGLTLFERAKQRHGEDRQTEREALLRSSIEQYEKTLTIDSENVAAHWNLSQLYRLLGDEEKAAEHGELHARYKPDDNARDRAVKLAREKYPAANHAAEALTIYPLRRPGAAELPAEAALAPAEGAVSDDDTVPAGNQVGGGP